MDEDMVWSSDSDISQSEIEDSFPSSTPAMSSRCQGGVLARKRPVLSTIPESESKLQAKMNATRSFHVIFVVDASNSMSQEDVVGPKYLEAIKASAPTTMSRLEAALEALQGFLA